MSTLPIRIVPSLSAAKKPDSGGLAFFLAFPSLFFLKFNSNVDARRFVFRFELCCMRCTRRWSMFGTVLVP